MGQRHATSVRGAFDLNIISDTEISRFTYYQLRPNLGILLSENDRKVVRGESLNTGFEMLFQNSDSMTFDQEVLKNFATIKLSEIRAAPLSPSSQFETFPHPSLISMVSIDASSKIKITSIASLTENYISVIKDSLDGINSPEDTEILLVDSYLDPRIEEYIYRSIDTKQTILCKITGECVWVGPLISRGSHSWRQIFERIRDNYPADHMIVAELNRPPVASRLISSVALRSIREIVVNLIESHRLGCEGTRATIFTSETPFDQWQRHGFLHSYPKPTSNLEIREIDGGRRSLTAHNLVAHCKSAIDKITGLVPGIRVVEHPPGVHVAITSQTFPSAHMLKENRKLGSRMGAAGKGESNIQAQASCIGEAIERYSASFQGDEYRVVSSLTALGSRAIDPRAVMLFSGLQYEKRDWWNANHGYFHFVPEPFSPDDVISWTKCQSFDGAIERLIPTSLVYFNFANFFPDEKAVCVADSNGCASGSTRIEAIIQATYELIERDACAVWWYNQIPRPELDVLSFTGEFVRKSPERYLSYKRTIKLIDLTNDLNVPVILAVSTNLGGSSICVGLGCHLDIEIAASRSIAELDQFIAMFGLDVINSSEGSGNIELDHWLKTQNIRDHAFMCPETAIPRAEYQNSLRAGTLNDEFLQLATILRVNIGEPYFVDLTRDEAPLHAVRVVVPGIRHFWARFAEGRLYDVPPKLGWSQFARAEEDLNPIPFFL